MLILVLLLEVVTDPVMTPDVLQPDTVRNKKLGEALAIILTFVLFSQRTLLALLLAKRKKLTLAKSQKVAHGTAYAFILGLVGARLTLLLHLAVGHLFYDPTKRLRRTHPSRVLAILMRVLGVVYTERL